MPRVPVLLLVSSLTVGSSSAATVLTVTSPADAGGGSLRQAILDANASADPDPVRIHFAIGTGAQSIAVTAGLPDVTRPVVIDGTTQPGFAGVPLVELRGDSAPAGINGLALAGHNGSTVRGLIVNRFKSLGSAGGFGILVGVGTSGHVIAGNYIGTNAAGTAAAGNGRGGVSCQGSNVTIGGTTVADRNVISGNGDYGVTMEAGSGVVIVGNYIGVNAAGTAAIPNVSGLFILNFSTNSRIGGDAAGERNVISGNTSANVLIGNATATGHVVRGNYIGTNAAGTAGVGASTGIVFNSGKQLTVERNVIVGGSIAGISIQNTSSLITVRGNAIGTTANGSTALPFSGRCVYVQVSASGAPVDVTIGGTGIGDGNILRNCAGGGVMLRSGIANNSQTFAAPKRIAIRGNSIDETGGLGIDLDQDGVTANDAGDADNDTVGSNFRQNFPAIGTATLSATNVAVQGTLDSIANATFAVDVFAGPAPDGSGHGEGRTYLGAVQVTTDAAGHGTFDHTFGVALPSGTWITATATDQTGNTSEFSAAVQAEDDPQNPPTTTSTVPTTTSASGTSTTSTSATTTSAPGSTSSTTASSTTATAPTSSSTTTTTVPCNVAGIPRVRCLLDLLPPAECAGAKVPPLAKRVVTTGRTLLDKAAATGGKAARRVLKRVAGRLGKAAGRVARAGKRGTLDQPCATTLSDGLTKARSEATAIVVP